MDMAAPRRLWTLFEPLHAVTYFAPQARAAFEEAGYRGFWRGYFAGRSAPLGAVGAAPVTALFYGFAQSMVARALPSVWDLAPPEEALAARRTGAVTALRHAFSAAGEAAAPDRPGPAVVDLLRRAVDAADRGGRALGAANAALPWPDEPVAALWHGATVLRELRGDGHVAALLTAGLTGLDALVLRSAHDLDRDILQQARGWSDQEWQAAADGLRSRGLVDHDAHATDRGRALLDEVEAVTDRLAAQPWSSLDPQEVEQLIDRLVPLRDAAATFLPERTPIGLPRER